MADYTSGGIFFSGIGSGTDFSSIIDKLKQVELMPAKRMSLWKDDWQRRVDAFKQLRTELSTFKTTTDGLDTLSEFFTKSATSSASNIVNATTDVKAMEGNYRIDVNQLATSGIWTFNGTFAAKTTAVNTSGSDQQFVYTYKGKQRSLTLANGTTIEGLVNIINSDSQNPGVRASLVKNGEQYTFQLRGADTGASATLDINVGTNLSGFPNTTTWTVQTARNAQYRVNGWPAIGWLESTTNTVSGVIEGVTMDLKDVGTSQITVAVDKAKIKEKVKAFIDGMNKVRSTLRSLTEVDKDKQTSDQTSTKSLYTAQKGSILTGNYGVQLLASRLDSTTANRGTGFMPQYEEGSVMRGDLFSSLSQVGILTNADQGSPDRGLLMFDEAKFDEALNKNPNAIAELFSTEGTGATDTANFRFDTYIKGVTKPGSYDLSYTVDASGNVVGATIDGEAAEYDSATKAIVSMKGNSRGVAVVVDNLTPGAYTGHVRLKQGKVAEINNTLKDMLSDTGALKILEKNYGEIMKDIDKKIDSETTRITKWERNIRQQYARLESLLAVYEKKNQAVSAQVSQLSK